MTRPTTAPVSSDAPAHPWIISILAVLVALLGLAGAARAQEGTVGPSAPPPPLQFILTYDAQLAESYTGPVYIVMANGGPPRLVPRAFGTDPIIVIDVEDWLPDTPLLVDAGRARSEPMDFDQIPVGRYFIQAFLPLSPDSFKPGDDGNAGSRTIASQASTFDTMPLQLHIDRRLEPVVVGPGSDRVATGTMPSERLSAFHGTPIEIGYSVALPPGYFLEPDRIYPSRIWLGSHGTSHHMGANSLRPLERFEGGNDIVTILVEITTRFGHPLFVDSASSGPWRTALMEELLPHLESRFRLDPSGRFLTGHAAGAWAALWLQMQHPDAFVATYAIAPWPATFHSWFGVDLYEAENALVAADGTPIAYGLMPDGRPAEPARQTWEREDLLVDGGAFRSFEWAFSPRGEDGRPRHFFDRATGVIDREVLEHWSRWDLVRFVEANAEALGDRLDGKLTIRIGGADGYRLHEPTQRLADALTTAGIDFTYQFVPDGRHGNIAELRYQMEVMREMTQRYGAILDSRAADATGAGTETADGGTGTGTGG